MERVSIGRTYVLRSMILALLLLWPLLTFGKPAYMVDSAAYQNGGENAVGFVLNKLYPGVPSATAPGAGALAKETVEGGDTKVARSIIYSVVGYIFGGPDHKMIYLSVFHALLVGLTVTALFEAVAGASVRGFATMAGVLTFGTGLAPVVNFAIPDILAGIMLAIMMVLPFYWRRFSVPMLLLLLALAIFGVAAHASHPPVALGTALVAGLWLFLLRRQGTERPSASLLALWAPALLGLALVALSGLVGFGKVSIAPKHHPLALARGIDNGPARWYLEDACRDRTSYAICEIYGTHIPKTVKELLWSPNNLIRRATPEQLDRIRAEEKTILLRSTLRYPAQQAYLVLHDVPAQFFTFRTDLRYGGTIVRSPKGDLMLANAAADETPPLLEWLDVVAKLVVVGATAALAWWWRGMTLAQRGMALTLATGLLANAAVCAIFSGVAPRYQARLIWLVPFAAIAIGFARGGFRIRDRVSSDPALNRN